MTEVSYAERARAKKMAQANAIGIDDTLISNLVEAFYSAIRSDELLGPIFLAQVADWTPHLARMKDFWASITLESGRFRGNPMLKHIAITGLDNEHFDRWLVLWDQTVDAVVPNDAAAQVFREAASRIADSLLTGIKIQRDGLMAVSKKPAAPYASSPIFDQDDLPEALRSYHSTKAGTWGLLRMLEGEVELVFVDPPSSRIVTVDNPAPIPPQALHFVKPDGPMKMQVEFYHNHPLGDDQADD